MDIKELRSKSEAELGVAMVETLKEHFNLRMQQGSGQLARPHLMKDARRNIARIKTIMRERAEKKA